MFNSLWVIKPGWVHWLLWFLKHTIERSLCHSFPFPIKWLSPPVASGYSLARTMYVKIPRPSSLQLCIQNCKQCHELVCLKFCLTRGACPALWTWSDVADTAEKPGSFCLYILSRRETAETLGWMRLQLSGLQAELGCSHVCLIRSV